MFDQVVGDAQDPGLVFRVCLPNLQNDMRFGKRKRDKFDGIHALQLCPR